MCASIFEKNLKAMEKWYPAFAEEVRNSSSEAEELQVQKEISQDGELIFRVKKEERLLYLNGKRSVKQPADIWMERLGDIHKHAPFFLFGIGSGIYLKKLIDKTDKSVAVVVYEPSYTIFRSLLNCADLTNEIEDRPIIFIVKGINDKVFVDVCNKIISIENLEFLKSEIHPNYQEIYLEDIVEKMKLVQKRAETVLASQNSNMLFSAYLVRNQMQNIKYVCDGYNTKCLVDTIPYTGPAILVSAGPSLNKNIMELKAAKNKAFILAVDTAIKPLIKAGIVPDAFCTIDPNKLLDLVEIDAAKDIPVVASGTANSELIAQQRGKKIFYNDGFILAQMAYLTVGKLMPMVESGGSVACSGFSLLYKLGFDTIILVGQDLAYTDNKSHADGTFESVMPEENTKGMVQVKGNYVDKLPTLPNLKTYLEWFEMYIKGIKEKRNVRVINATEGGAYIEGTELMSLHDAVKETCGGEEIDFGACIEQIESVFTEEDRKKIIKCLHAIPNQLEEIKSYAKKIYSAYHKINLMCRKGNMNKLEYLKLLKKVKKLTKKCEGVGAYQLVSSTMAVGEYIVKSESLYELDTIEEEGKAVSKQGMKYAKFLQQCVTILKDYADEILLEIQ